MLLADCLAHTDTAVVDPRSWQPGALVTGTGGSMLAIRDGAAVGVCADDPARGDAGYRLNTVWPGGQPISGVLGQVLFEPLAGVAPNQFRTAVVGVAGDAVANVYLTQPGQAPQLVHPVDSTFAFVVTSGQLLNPGVLQLRLADKAGHLLYEGAM